MNEQAATPQEKALRANAALDSELDAANALAFERDVQSDAELRRFYTQAHETSAAVRAHFERESAPDSLRVRVLALAAAPKPAAQPWPRYALAASLTAFAFLAGAGADRLIRPPAPGAEQTLVADFARAQIAGQPFDIASSDRHTVKPWLASRVALGAEAVDLADAGFPLAGGRVDVIARAPMPTLVYRRREHFIALSELPPDGGATRASTVDGYNVLRWSDPSRSYVAVSDMDADELANFAHLFREKAAMAAGEGR